MKASITGLPREQEYPVCEMEISIAAPEKVFVDCGAFHYKNLDVPKFKIGGFANALTATEIFKEEKTSLTE